MITAIARFDSYTGAVKALTANVDVVGWSAGGNRAVLTGARYGDRFPGLSGTQVGNLRCSLQSTVGGEVPTNSILFTIRRLR
jgi:hypothetical protein